MKLRLKGLLMLAWCASSAPTQAVEQSAFSKIYLQRVSQTNLPEAYATGGYTVVGAPSRLMLQDTWQETCGWEVAYSIEPRWQNPAPESRQEAIAQKRNYRLYDSAAHLWKSQNDRHAIIYQNIDRAFLSLKVGRADIFIGRQAIAFGASRTIQPTDVLAPFAYSDIHTEYRPGVDAIRAKLALGSLSELDIGFVGEEDEESQKKKQAASFLRAHTYFWQIDFGVMLMRFRAANLVGLNLQRPLGYVGWTLEAAWVDPKDEESYTRLTTGFDYAFSEESFGYIEYHFNGAGSGDSAVYLDRRSHFAFRRGGAFLFGREYLIPGLSYTTSPLLTLNLQVIHNLNDRSQYTSGHLSYNVLQDTYTDFGAALPTGSKGREVNGELELTSEYGSQPSFYYASVRQYF